MIGRLTNLRRLFGGEWEVTFSTKGDAGTVYDRLKDSDVNVEIKKYNPGRSKDANAFCWALCTDIGKAIRPPVPKEEVYRKAIREVGEYEPKIDLGHGVFVKFKIRILDDSPEAAE